MKKIISIIGARPQFIKHAPMQLALQKVFNAITIHTGQHYDSNMSQVFFEQLSIPKPDYLLDMGGSKMHGEQTALMMVEIEKICILEKPDAILVYGDTNSTLAGVLVAAKMLIPIIHIEAGLRSFNRTMPEEVNRIIADEFAQLLFCPTQSAIDNLKKEGITHQNIFLCGDVMCDMLQMVLPNIINKVNSPYYFATLHRPYNTDDDARLMQILNVFNALDKKVIFAIHPRTVARMASFGMDKSNYSNVEFIEPVGYLESISYQAFSNCIITDSGGMQKEAYMLQKKCITIRSETEWTETLIGQWNNLVFENLDEMPKIINTTTSQYQHNLYGNGAAAIEITELIKNHLF
jgi:UDP-GlcNAc3NAcA epimerase